MTNPTSAQRVRTRPQLIMESRPEDLSARDDCRHCQAEGKACGRAHYENIAYSWKTGADRVGRAVTRDEIQSPVLPEYGPRNGSGSSARPVGGRPASQKQVDLIEKLLGEKVTDGTKYAGRTTVPASLTSRDASAAIDDLFKLPRKSTQTRTFEPLPEVHEGRYALDFGADHDGINQIRFYKVDRPTEGRWAGRTFVKRLESDQEVRVSFGETKDVLARIAANEQEAMERFGRETKTCGHCGRRLTNDESRDRGIGPVCAAKMDW